MTDKPANTVCPLLAAPCLKEGCEWMWYEYKGKMNMYRVCPIIKMVNHLQFIEWGVKPPTYRRSGGRDGDF